LPAQTVAALDTVPPALDAAEAAIKTCSAPGIVLHAQMAIQAAHLQLHDAYRGDQAALIALKTNLELIRSSVETCNDIARAVVRCRGDVRLGMTKAEVKETAWCEPSRIVQTEAAAGHRERWIYSKDRRAPGLDRPVGSLEFTGDRLTSIRRRSQ